MKIREFFRENHPDLSKCGHLNFFQLCADGQWVPVDPIGHAAIKAGFNFLEGEAKGGVIVWLTNTFSIPREVLRTFYESWDLWYHPDWEEHTFNLSLKEAELVEEDLYPSEGGLK